MVGVFAARNKPITQPLGATVLPYKEQIRAASEAFSENRQMLNRPPSDNNNTMVQNLLARMQHMQQNHEEMQTAHYQALEQ